MKKFAFLLGTISAAVIVTAADLDWKASNGNVKIEDGLVEVAAPNSEGGVASAKIDLRAYANEAIVISVRGEARGVGKPPQHWNGIKVMLSFRDAKTGKTSYTSALNGSFGDIGPEIFRTFADFRGKEVTEGNVSLGLESVSGKIRFDLNTFKIEKVTPAKYTRNVLEAKPLKGVMLPHSRPLTDDDFATLKRWGVTLARFQMVRAARDENAKQDLLGFDRWLDMRLKWLEGALKLGEKYGIKLIVDMHSTPGGGSGATGNHRIFENGPWAQHYLDAWTKVVTRFKGRKGIYAFDLVNEPHNPKPKTEDCWNLQYKAAEIVRAIDPITPITIETDWGDLPKPFEWLCPLPFTNIIYQVHIYSPSKFTHQRVGAGHNGFAVYPGMIDGVKWDRQRMREELKPVREFQLRYGARILVGEFSAAIWAKGAEQWLSDAIALFNEYGWDWTYHAFREAECWSLEHEGTSWSDVRPSTDNSRKRAVLEGLR